MTFDHKPFNDKLQIPTKLQRLNSSADSIYSVIESALP